MKRILLLLCIIYSSIFGQGLITEIGKFGNANSFYINPAGFIYVIDSDNNEVIKLDTLGNVLFSTGGYGWGEATFDEPTDIFATTLKVYIADKNNNRIQEFDKDLNYRQQLKGDEEKYSNYPFAYPTSCAVSNHGDFFILDSDNQRIIKYNLASGFLLEIGNFDAGNYMLTSPKKLSISPDGKIFVLDESEIFVYDQFGMGIVKLSPKLQPTNLNITFNNLVLNNNNNIKYIDLTDTKSGFIDFRLDDTFSDYEIVEAALFNKKMYILTQSVILVYTLY